MRFNMKINAVVMATVIGLTSTLMVSNQAWAQDVAEPTNSTTVRQEIRRELRQAGLAAAAAVLGMTPEEVQSEVEAGKTLADLAQASDVELSDVRAAVHEAIKAERQDFVQRFIAKQVEAGRMTQEQADWLNQGINNGWFGDLRRLFGRFEDLRGEGFDLRRGRVWTYLHEQE